MKVLILTNGEYGDYSFCQEESHYDRVICADRGICHARALGITPDLIVGDFDSGSEEDLTYFESQGIRVLRFKPEKDETDTEIAVQQAIEMGAKEVDIYGGLGSRLDHSLANIHLLYPLLKRGISGRLLNPNNSVSLAMHQCIIKGEKGDLVSLIPFAGDVEGVTTTGLAYALHNATIPIGTSLGISNYLLGQVAEVTIKKGVLIVIKAND